MKTQINSILFPTDFSELSESALKVGVAIAKRQNAEITLLHVVSTFSYLQPNQIFLPDYQLLPNMKSSFEEKLKPLAERIQKETGINIRSEVLSGIPSDMICQFASKENISLIVMGTHGTSGLREFFIGSEAYRVVKNATCPVLTIPGNWQKTDFEKVLFPIRMHPEALDKYFYARPIIEKNNSHLILLGLAEEKKTGDVKAITLLMDQLKLQLQNDNVEFESALSPGENFAAKVIEMSNDKDTDLIILTANLDHNFKTYFLGTYVQQIVNHSRVPVLSIKPSEIQHEESDPYQRVEKWGKGIDF